MASRFHAKKDMSPALLISLLGLTVILVCAYKQSTVLRSQESSPYESTAAGHGESLNCTPTVKTFAKCCLPVTALASVPGSGNTWMRHLLEEATGIYTGSRFYDRNLAAGGFLGEDRQDDTVVAIKTHGCDEPWKLEFERAVVIIRNPYDMLRTCFNMRYGGHTGYAPEEAYTSGNWTADVKSLSAQWVKFHLCWFNRTIPVHIVRYEKLKANLKAEFSKILDFLHLPIAEQKLECLLRNSEGSFHRPHRKTSVEDPFTETMKETLDRYVATAEKALQYRVSHWVDGAGFHTS